MLIPAHLNLIQQICVHSAFFCYFRLVLHFSYISACCFSQFQLFFQQALLKEAFILHFHRKHHFSSLFRCHVEMNVMFRQVFRVKRWFSQRRGISERSCSSGGPIKKSMLSHSANLGGALCRMAAPGGGARTAG